MGRFHEYVDAPPKDVYFLLSLTHVLNDRDFLKDIAKNNDLFAVHFYFSVFGADMNSDGIKNIVDAIVQEDNLYLLSWCLKTYGKRVDYILSSCAMRSSLRLLRYALKYLPTDEDRKRYVLESAFEVAKIKGHHEVMEILMDYLSEEEQMKLLNDAVNYIPPANFWEDHRYPKMIGWVMDQLELRKNPVDYRMYLRRYAMREYFPGAQLIIKRCPNMDLTEEIKKSIKVLEDHQSAQKYFPYIESLFLYSKK